MAATVLTSGQWLAVTGTKQEVIDWLAQNETEITIYSLAVEDAVSGKLTAVVRAK